MRNFLSKYLTTEELNKLEEAYKSKNEGATGLPVYIPKSRFDEVDGKRKAAEQLVAGFESEKQKAVKEATAAYAAIPEDWKKQLDDAKSALETQKVAYEKQLKEASEAADVTAKIYESGARNVKAVRALLDSSKPIEEQLEALKTSDSYLFKGRGNKGTGKDGGDGDGNGSEGDKDKLSTADMYRAVGIAVPQ